MTQAPFAPTLALTAVLALAGVAIAIGIVLIVDRPTSLGPVLPAQNQDAETRLFLLAYFVILPLSIFAGPRLADRIAAGPNRDGLAAAQRAAGGDLLGAVLLLEGLGLAPLGRRGRCPAGHRAGLGHRRLGGPVPGRRGRAHGRRC